MNTPPRQSPRPMLSGVSTPFKMTGAGSQALQKGMVLRFKKEIPQAIEVIEKAYRTFLSTENLLGQAFCLIELAWLYGNGNEKARSEKLFRDAEDLLVKSAKFEGVSEARARLHHYRGLLLYQQESYGGALKLFKEALTFCDPNGLESAKIFDSLGVHYERTGDFHRAVRYLKSSLWIKTSLKEPLHEEAVTCQILGRLYLLYEEYETAYTHLERSLEISAALKDEKRKASIKNEMIRLFLRCGKEVEARQLIEEAKQETHHRHLKIQNAMTLFYEAYLYFRHQEMHESQMILEKLALPVFEKHHYRKGLAMAKRLQAWVTLRLHPKSTNEAVALMGEAIELFRYENQIDEVAKSHYELGKLYLELGNQELALTSFLDTLKLAEENGLFYLTPYIEDEIFRTHEAQWEDIVNKRTRHERVFDKEYSLVEALSQYVEQATQPDGIEIENQGQLPHLVSLLKVGQAMAAERDLDKLLGIIKSETERALNAERCNVFLYNEESNELWSRASSGLETEEIRFPAHQGLAGYVVKTGETLNIKDASQDPRFNAEVDKQTGLTTTSLLCMPMRNRKGHNIGVFQVLNKKNAIFQKQDEELLMAIASSAGVALENAQLYRELKITFESLISALSSTIDARDPITAGHSERVMEYSLMIGEEMHLGDDELEVLKYSALLHDIGKIGVKEEVLVKQGRLTEKEYRHIQQHVFFTHEILKNIHFEKHLATVPEVAASHHEKMDGSGYFRGLKGDQIILGGRILAVADVFDAITSRRQYRTRMPFDRVMAVMKQESGTHFDSDIVDTFLECRLSDLARVLCMDSHLKVSETEMQRTLKKIPNNVSIRDYLTLMNKKKRSPEDEKTHSAFTALYHFSEISDLD